jgi:hypothetical protein
MENFNITIKNLVLFYFVTTKQGDIGLGFNFKKINKEKIVHGASNKEH